MKIVIACAKRTASAKEIYFTVYKVHRHASSRAGKSSRNLRLIPVVFACVEGVKVIKTPSAIPTAKDKQLGPV